MVLSAKTQFLNFLRRGFMVPAMENVLYELTNGRTPTHFFSKFLPNHYQYSVGSNRIKSRDGIEYILDLSDFVDHKIFFGLQDKSDKVLFSQIREDSTVIDVGSNNGHFALKMAAKAKAGKVIGFEPDPKNFQRCADNLRLNKFSNVQIHKMALGDSEGEAILARANPKNQGMNRLILEQDKAPADTVNVKLATLDHMKEILDLKTISLINVSSTIRND